MVEIAAAINQPAVAPVMKEAAVWFSGEICGTMVEAYVTKERVPDAYIERIKRFPMRKMSPLHDSIAADKPEIRERFLTTNAHIDYMVDLEQDCLRQYEEKGFAEIGVDYSAAGLKKVFILPNHPVG